MRQITVQARSAAASDALAAARRMLDDAENHTWRAAAHAYAAGALELAQEAERLQQAIATAKSVGP